MSDPIEPSVSEADSYFDIAGEDLSDASLREGVSTWGDATEPGSEIVARRDTSRGMVNDEKTIDYGEDTDETSSKTKLVVPALSYWYLFVLFLCYVSNQWDRYLLNYLYNVPTKNKSPSTQRFQSLKIGTGIDGTEYGILVGVGFTAFYATACLFSGTLSDRFPRKWLLAGGLTVWSLACAAMGLADNFGELLACRIFLGMGQAFCGPPSYSLIADYFPAEMHAQANGLYVFGIYVGGGLASISLIMTQTLGWRGTSYLVGGTGIIFLLLLVFTLREPPRRNYKKKHTDDDEKPVDSEVDTVVRSRRSASQTDTKTQPLLEDSTSDVLSYDDFADDGIVPRSENTQLSVWESLKLTLGPFSMRLLFVASALRFMGGFAIAGFLPTYYKNHYPNHKSQYSLLNAAVVSVGGALSAYMGGYLADRWGARDVRYKSFVPALGCVLGIPAMALCLMVNNFYLSIFGLFLEYLVAECWFGPALAIISAEVDHRVRGFATATFIFITTLVGSISPIVIGDLDDKYRTVRTELMFAVTISYGLTAICFLILGITMRHQQLKDFAVYGADENGLLDEDAMVDPFQTDIIAGPLSDNENVSINGA